MSVDQTPEFVDEIVALDEVTRQRIEGALLHLKDAGSEARQRFEAFRVESEVRLRPLNDAIRASELLTDRDFAIRINTRD